MATGSSSELDMNHWLYRFLALVIDSIIIGIPVSIIYYVVILSLVFGGGLFFFAGAWWLSWLLLPFIFGILELLYFVIMEVSFGGATIGKKLMGLQVQMVNGGQVTFDKSFIRNISKVYGYGLFLLLDWILGIATPGPDRRQKYTDRMAGTTVVSVRQPFASVSAPPPPPPPPPTS